MLHPISKYSCEVHKYMLSNYFCEKLVLRGTFGKVWRIHIQIYPQTLMKSKYGAFYLNNEVRVHGLALLVQLS